MAVGKQYLLGYNVLQTVGWSYMALQLGQHYALGGSTETLWERMKYTVMIFQSLAALEVLHCVVGLVRSNPMVTLMQVFSRLFLVWYVCYMSDDSKTSIGLPMMLTAWSITEIIRYSYYAFGLVGAEPLVLQFLRYTTFIVLYPLGVTGEQLCSFAALPYYYRERPFSIALPNILNVTFDSYMFLILVMLNYIPFFPQLYLHMFAQRKKVLGRKKE